MSQSRNPPGADFAIFADNSRSVWGEPHLNGTWHRPCSFGGRAPIPSMSLVSRHVSGVPLVRNGLLIGGLLVAIGCGRVGFRSPGLDDGGTGRIDAFLRLGDAAAGDGSRGDSGIPSDAGRDSGEGDARSDAGDGLDAGVSPDTGGSGRVPGAVVLYLFDEGSGDTVVDQGPDPKSNLTIVPTSAVTWGASELILDTAARVASPFAPSKVITACQTTGEISVEAWVTPLNASQGGPARLVTLAESRVSQNFLVGQRATRYAARLRTTDTDDLGSPEVSSIPGTATVALTHVVFTHNAIDETDRLYVNGSLVGADPRTGTFAGWDRTHRLVLGNDLLDDRPWLGTFHLVAIYGRALSQTEVQQNFDAGAD